MTIRNSGRSAPIASGLVNRKMPRSGIFAPVPLYTSDLLDLAQLGTVPRNVVFARGLGPQTLPPLSRGKTISTLFAKYRVKSARIRVESAVPTTAGGQYAVFFDPNPLNDWTQQDAIGALTSMPVQSVAAAWECVTLDIPKAELERATELYTQEATSETLVTRFGQVVILNLAVSSTTPAGTAAVTVWLDADWEFYEPNASAPVAAETVVFPVGDWTLSSTGVLSGPTGSTGDVFSQTAYLVTPDLPTALAVPPIAISYVAFYKQAQDGHLHAFDTEEHAIAYATSGALAGAYTGNGTPQPAPRTVLTPIAHFANGYQLAA